MTGSTPPKGLGSKWGGDFYSYQLQLQLTKSLIINFFCFKELNINKPVFFVSLKQDHLGRDEVSYSLEKC